MENNHITSFSPQPTTDQQNKFSSQSSNCGITTLASTFGHNLLPLRNDNEILLSSSVKCSTTTKQKLPIETNENSQNLELCDSIISSEKVIHIRFLLADF